MNITLPDGTQQAIPDDAYSLPFFGQQPSFQADFVTAELQQFAADNKEIQQETQASYDQWQITNTTNRADGQPLTAKPVDQFSWVFHYVFDKGHTLYWWQTNDGPPVVDHPCPDLPALPATLTGPIIGTRIGDPNSSTYKLGRLFAAGALVGTQDEFDSTPNGTQVQGTSADGVKGVFLKIGSPFGGGYWELLS